MIMSRRVSQLVCMDDCAGVAACAQTAECCAWWRIACHGVLPLCIPMGAWLLHARWASKWC